MTTSRVTRALQVLNAGLQLGLLAVEVRDLCAQRLKQSEDAPLVVDQHPDGSRQPFVELLGSLDESMEALRGIDIKLAANQAALDRLDLRAQDLDVVSHPSTVEPDAVTPQANGSRA